MISVVLKIRSARVWRMRRQFSKRRCYDDAHQNTQASKLLASVGLSSYYDAGYRQPA